MVAFCRISSVRKLSAVVPATNLIALRPASSISSRYASSRHINGFRRFQNVAAPDVIGARFNRSSFDQVHLSTEDPREFPAHLVEFSQARIDSEVKAYQYINVAIRPAIAAQHRSEQR